MIPPAFSSDHAWYAVAGAVCAALVLVLRELWPR